MPVRIVYEQLKETKMHKKCIVTGCYNTPGRWAQQIWSLAERQNKMTEIVGMCESHIRDHFTRIKIAKIKGGSPIEFKFDYQNERPELKLPEEINTQKVAQILNCKPGEVNFLVRIGSLEGRHSYNGKGGYLITLESLRSLIEALDDGDLDHHQVYPIRPDLLIDLLDRMPDIKASLSDFYTSFYSAPD